MDGEKVLIGPRLKKIFWAYLLCFTAAVILWPVSPSPGDPLPVQSLYAIQKLPWFSVLFCAWSFFLSALLFLAEGSKWERLALCLVFFITYVLFWTFAGPWGTHSDSTWITAHVAYLHDTGRIPVENTNFRYFEYPALQLAGLTLIQTTGLDLFQGVQLFLLVNGIIFVTVLYTAFWKLLGNPNHAAAGVFLAVAMNQVLSLVHNYYHPISLASTYVALFVLLLIRYNDLGGRNLTFGILYLLLVLAATIEYLFTPVLFGMVFLSSWAVYKKLKVKGVSSLNTFALTLVLFTVWLVFITVITSRTLAAGLDKIITDFQDNTWLLYLVQEFTAQGGSQLQSFKR